MKRAILVASLLVATTVGAQPSAPRVNVNTATLEQLCYLPGIGRVMAQRIVDGRPYRAPGSLIDVKGIKDARLKVLFPFVTVSGPTTASAKIVPCKAGETGAQCQARVGDDGSREVIAYANGVLVVEVKP